MPTSKEQLLEIIQNGRQFLSALEQFAATNFPNNDDDDNETTNMLNKILRDDESGRFEDAERFTDDVDGHNGKTTTPSTTFAKKRVASIDTANEASNRSEECPAEATTPDTNTQEDNVVRNPTDQLVRNPSPEQPAKSLRPDLPGGAIAQYCATTGKVLAQYQSLTEAVESVAKTLPDTKYSSCRDAINSIFRRRKKTPSYKGWYFREIGDATPMPSFPITCDSYVAESAQVNPTITRDESGQKRRREEPNPVQPVVKYRKKHRVLQYCAKTGNHLGRFDSVAAAAKSLHSSIPDKTEAQFLSGICAILNGRQTLPIYHGFYFRSSEDVTSPFPEFPIPETNSEFRETTLGKFRREEHQKKIKEAAETAAFRARKSGKNRALLLFCAHTGKQLGKFDSQKHAATVLVKSMPESTLQTLSARICAVINRRDKSYNGWYFRYLDDTLNPMPRFPMSKLAGVAPQLEHDDDALVTKPDTTQND